MWVDKGFCGRPRWGKLKMRKWDWLMGLAELWRDNWRQLIVNDRPTSTGKGINQADYSSQLGF